MAKGKKVDEDDDDDGEEVTLALSWGVRDKFIWAKNRLGNKFIDCPQAKKGKRKKGNIRIAKRFSTARVVLCLSFLHEHYIISRLTAGRIPKRILMTIGRSQVSLGRIPSTKFALGHLVKAPVRERGPLYRATSFLSFFLSFKRMHSSICRPTGSNLLFFTSGFCSFFLFFFCSGFFFFGKSLTRVSHLPHKQKVPKSSLSPPATLLCPFSGTPRLVLWKNALVIWHIEPKKERELISCRLITDTSTHCPTYLPRSLAPSRCVLFMLY